MASYAKPIGNLGVSSQSNVATLARGRWHNRLRVYLILSMQVKSVVNSSITHVITYLLLQHAWCLRFADTESVKSQAWRTVLYPHSSVCVTPAMQMCSTWLLASALTIVSQQTKPTLYIFSQTQLWMQKEPCYEKYDAKPREWQRMLFIFIKRMHFHIT